MQGYRALADTILILHAGIVLFVVGGLLLIVLGNLASWSWVNRLWLRVVHLIAIAVVVAETWLGITCPLTSLEAWLRSKAGLASYGQSFVEHWAHRLLFYQAPPWVFTTAYTIFGIAVAAAWYFFPPKIGRRGKKAREV